MSDFYDLTGMTPIAARQYIVSVGAQLKLDQTKVADLNKDIALWQNRATLATEKGATELAGQASAMVQELTNKRTALEIEIMEIEQGVERMKAQLRTPEFLSPRTIDANALLESLEAIAGPTDNVSPALKKVEVDSALEALKKKLDPNYVSPTPPPTVATPAASPPSVDGGISPSTPPSAETNPPPASPEQPPAPDLKV